MPKTRNRSRNKVIVGLSGGVDSSVAAALLVERGFDVRGVYMKNWHSDDPKFKGVCPWEEDLRDARAVAARLDVPFEVWNFEKQYHDRVVRYFFSEYRRGRTPNPDVMCNKEIKFHAFLEKALKAGADYVATGHYARIRENPPLRQGFAGQANLYGKPETSNQLHLTSNSFCLYSGKDKSKDQSYFLWAIDKGVLPRVLMPVGDFTKPQIRRLARSLHLPTAEKKDSQGICFIGPINVKEYLKTNLPTREGSIVNTNGEVVGRHGGVWFYTEGQRAGIGTTGGGVPYYIIEKKLADNILVVASRRDPKLFARGLVAGELNWLVATLPNKFAALARIRYRHALVPVKVVLEGKLARVEFDTPQRAVTPGQSIVFYQKDLILGGGVIERPVL
ncbi:MAG TPA: tRNA 2-thiouridine(34) synthase MnmA [Patescibacteria group bacterium]|nr:tRNA 2-thiouridine(34) synthase MnmA [Patescibacteria group bacterium]